MGRGLAALGLALAAVVGLAVRPAGAVSGLVVGSWWTGQAADGTVPPPPTLPAGGLWVGYAPSGPTAISAIKVTLADNERAPTIALSVHSQQPSGAASVGACQATSDWTPVDAGPMSAAPHFDCGSGVIQGTANSDGTILTFDLSSFVVGNQINVVFEPNPAPVAPPQAPVAAPVTSPLSPPVSTTLPAATAFDITFDAPAPKDIAVVVTPVDTEEPPATVPYTEPAPEPDLPLYSVPTDSGLPVLDAPTTVAPPAVAVPVVNIPRRVAPVLPTSTSGAARAIAGAVFLALVAWMGRDAFFPTAATRRVTIYDELPSRGTAARSPRVGRAPPLR